MRNVQAHYDAIKNRAMMCTILIKTGSCPFRNCPYSHEFFADVDISIPVELLRIHSLPPSLKQKAGYNPYATHLNQCEWG